MIPPTQATKVWWWVCGVIAAVVILTIIAIIFKPWLLWVNVRVNDAIPTAVSTTTVSTPADSVAEPATQPLHPVQPIDLSSGTFIGHEHQTTGSARVIQLPNGSNQLALENLSTSSGPDVHVWLSSAPVIAGIDGWKVAGDYPYVDLGPIKGNQGNQLYDIPAGTPLQNYPTVELWCVQFSVSFGAAALTS